MFELAIGTLDNIFEERKTEKISDQEKIKIFTPRSGDSRSCHSYHPTRAPSTYYYYARLGLGDNSSSQPVHHRKNITYAKYRDAFLHSPVSTVCGFLVIHDLVTCSTRNSVFNLNNIELHPDALLQFIYVSV
jgi:hypothetical protein